MAPEKSPAFQFYPKDYLSDPRVRAMTFEQRGLYWEAICICWLEGTLPSDLIELAAILRCPVKRIRKIWPLISRCFDQHGDRLTHKRLDKERAAQADSRDRRAAAAQKRWEKEQKTDAMHMQSNAGEQSPVDAKQCSSSPSSSPSSTSSPTPVKAEPPRRIISGAASPLGWAKVHSSHVPDFCDWVCLPDFIFEEFRGKSGQTQLPDGGAAYVMGWARTVHERWGRQSIGEDNLKFWRERWAESHPKSSVKQPDPAHVERMLAIERGERKR